MGDAINIIALLGGVRATIFAGVAVAALAFSGVQTYRLNDVQADLANTKANYAAAAQEWAEEQLDQAELLQQKLAEVTTTHLQEKAHAKQEYDRTIADLRSGQRQLRERFTCPAPVVQPGSPSGGNGGEESGLLREDAEFLISEAQRADEIVGQLKLAQETIRILLEARENE